MNQIPSHQSDPKQRARLRWRARRGLLENDLLITRFLDKYELDLTDEDVASLTVLFEATDNELMDLLLGRKELDGEMDTPAMRKVVQMIKDS
jgi:antitoxin CptB